MASLLAWAGNKIKQDIVKPIQRDVVAPVAHAAGNVQHAAGNVVNAASMHSINNVANSNFNPSHLVENYAVRPGMELGSGIGTLAYNHVIAPTFKLPKETLGTAFKNSSNPNLRANANAVSKLNFGQQAANAISLGSNAIPGGGGLVDRVATKLATPVAERLGSKLAGQVVNKAVQYGGKATLGGATGYGLGAGTTLAQGGTLAQANKAGAANAKLGFILGGAAPALHDTVPHVVDAGKAVHVLRPSALNDTEVAHLNKFVDAKSTNEMTNDVYQKGVAAAKKAGVDPNDAKAVDDLLGAHRTHTTVVNQRIQTLNEAKNGIQKYAQDHPIGMTSGAVDSEGNKLGLNGKPLKQAKIPDLKTRSTAADRPAPIKQLMKQKQEQLAKGAKVPRKATPPPTPPEEPPEIPKPGDIPTSNAGPVKRTRFTSKTVQNSDEVAPETKAQTDASYTSDTMKGAQARAQQHIADNGEKNSLEQTISELNVKRGTASRDTIARAIEHAKAQDALGTEAGNTMASKLYELAGEHGSAAGQQSQILSAIARRSPVGLRNKAFRDLKENGIDVNKPENAHIKKEIQGHIDTIKSMPDGPAKDFQTAVLQKAVLKHIPQSKTDQALSLWKAGLLSGVRTHGGNIVSNATFGALKKVSDIPAAMTDKAISLGTKTRTKTLTNKGLGGGTISGLKHAGTTLKTGIDERNVGDKYEQHAELNLGNKYLQKTVGNAANGVFRVLGAADQPTYYATLKNSLYDQAKADGLNQGLKGKALRDHMNNLVQDPTEKMVDTAGKEADKSVLGYDTLASKAVQGIHKGIDNFPGASKGGKTIAHAVVNVLAPFVRVPSAFISRTIDFTPAGPFKEAISQIGHKTFDQRALSQAIGEGLTGTGVIALGINLSQKNLISGDYPTGNPKEAARWKAEGITPNSVKLGNKWVSMNYLGPVGLLFNAGHQMQTSQGSSGGAKAGQALAGLGQGLMGQSFLQGFSGFSDAINNPQQSAKSYINSEASSIIPGISNDVANATDKYQRTSDTVPQAIENRIPGLRESGGAKTIKTDVYGNQLLQPSSAPNVLNPLRPSNSLSNPVISEVARLHNVDPNNPDLQVTPTPVDKTITVEGTKVNLSNSQREALQTKVGQTTQTNWGKLIQTPEYKALNDTDKAKALSDLRTDSSALATRQYIVNNNLGTYNKPVSASVAALGEGTGDLASYATKAALPAGSTTNAAYYTAPDAEYKTLKATYDAKVKSNGFADDAAKINAQNALAKAQVGSTFDKSVRDLYGLSNANLYQYVSTNPDGSAIAQKVLAYGDALASAGLETKNKFRNKYGSVIIGDTSTSGSGGSKGPTASQVSKMQSTRLKFKTPSFKSSVPKVAKLKTAARKKIPAPKISNPKVTGKKAQVV